MNNDIGWCMNLILSGLHSKLGDMLVNWFTIVSEQYYRLIGAKPSSNLQSNWALNE